MIRQWSRVWTRERTSIRGFLEGSPSEITSHARPVARSTGAGEKENRVRRIQGGQRPEVKRKKREEEKRGDVWQSYCRFCIRRKVVSPLAHPTMRGPNLLFHPIPFFFAATFVSSIFLSLLCTCVCMCVRLGQPVRQSPSTRKKQLKRLKSPKARREAKRDRKPCEFFAGCSSPFFYLLPSTSIFTAWDREQEPGGGTLGAGILRLVLELPRAIAPESNFHSNLLFEQG